jgi:GNAT superfamily N-acetyltransferase
MSFHLRTATMQDHDAILALMTSVIHDSVEPAHQPGTIENVSKNLGIWNSAPESCTHLVAELAEGVVGVILVKDFWNLCSLFVATEHQGRGIGQALVLAALDQCRTRSPKQAIHLNAAPSAIGFYLALGFEHRQSNQVLAPGFTPMRYPFIR